MDCQLGASPTFSDLKQFTDEELHSTFRFSQNPRVNKISGRNSQGKSTRADNHTATSHNIFCAMFLEAGGQKTC